MKFLSVLFVVLYFHTVVSATTPNQNNIREVLYEQSTIARNVQTKYGRPLDNNQYNSIDTPVSLKGQPPEDSGGQPNLQSSEDAFLRSEDSLEHQGLSPKSTGKERRILPVVNNSEAILTRTLLDGLKSEQSKNLQNERFENQSFYQPGGGGPEDNKVFSRNMPNSDLQNTILQNTYTNPKYFNSVSKVIKTYKNQPNIKQPLKVEEETRLDLQGITLEKIKSITTPPSVKSPSEGELSSFKNSNLDKDNYNSLRYIINKAKKLQNIRESAKKLKRYMVVHPDGTVEHVDKLDAVAKKNLNYVAVHSKDLSQLQNTLRNQSVNKDANTKATNSKNVVGIKSDKSAKLPTISAVKHNSSSSVMQHDLTKKEHLQNNAIADVINVINPKETMLNKSSVPSNSSEIKPMQTDSEPLPDSKLGSILKLNSTTFPLHSEITSSEKNSNIKESSFGWVPVNVDQKETDNFNKTSSLPLSSTPSLANTDHSGVWFQDKDFWERVQNDKNNVFYFLFVPSAPQFKNETKTIIYANGTTVEEVIEIADDEDGHPIATKTTKITHAEEGKKQILYITANRPDIVLVDRSVRRAIIVDITIPHDDNLVKAEKEKVSKYLDLAHEITAIVEC
ncbi:jg9462 [Pararge aegeria aegeria]|uniref:Jg9462 protein n=1 Tax=Pararge aegeria aegeria TaxID=348720 RepID=A0A8S4RLG5_9NEOP|nr:jg9462 [Pararge aegeria aegeria]